MHPKFEYTFFESASGDVYVAAQGLLGAFLEGVGWDEKDIKVIGSVTGSDLELLNTNHPLYNRKSPIILGEMLHLKPVPVRCILLRVTVLKTMK